MDWQKNKINSFFSERKQNRIQSILDGLLINKQPEEKLYNNLFVPIFPDKKEFPLLWRAMDIDQKCDFLKIAAKVIDAYKKAWGHHPEFIPMFVKNILRLL